MIRMLLTGFEPFDNEPTNASWELVRNLENLEFPNVQLRVRQLPTVFGESQKKLEAELDEFQPDVVLCVGQAGGRSAMSFERIGINMNDARIADNAGYQPSEEKIEEDGPDAYFATLPIRRLVTLLKEHGIPAEESLTAGTYVCNHVLYGLLHALHQRNRQHTVQAGFLHIPFLPSQSVRHRNAPSLSLETLSKGLELVVQELSVGTTVH